MKPREYHSKGVEMIAAERQRQITKEKWSADHDDEHQWWELCRAAATYCINTVEQSIDFNPTQRHVLAAAANVLWAWESQWHKPSKSAMKNLVRAGALIAAEIDRLQREANMSYKLCKDCGCPVLKKGQKRRHPDDYRHAVGCRYARGQYYRKVIQSLKGDAK